MKVKDVKRKTSKVCKMLLVSTLAISIIPFSPKEVKAATNDLAKYYLNAYAPVRGIEKGGKAQIQSYVKNVSTNKRIENVEYTYKSSDPEIVEVRGNEIIAKKDGFAVITVNADVNDPQQGVVEDEIHVVVGDKKKASYLTDAQAIENAKNNVNRYEWAKQEQAQAVAKAEKYAQRYDEIYGLIVSTIFPRSIWTVEHKSNNPGVNTNMVPTTGENIFNNYGHYSWIVDPLNHPYKVLDPTTKDAFPTNDFGAYYKSDLNEYNEFEPELADRSLLVNTDPKFKDKGEKWGVDDGFNTIFDKNTPGGEVRSFIPYYMHWGLWFHNGNIEATGLIQESSGLVQQSLQALREAYSLTGNKQYAIAGAILLDRVADVYPEMKTEFHPEYLNSDGGRKHGRVIGSIWETELSLEFALSYDCFYSAFEEPVVIDYLSKKSSQYHMLNKKDSANAIRQNIEDGILREIYDAVTHADIYGNFGMHQATLIAAAIALDTAPESNEWIEFCFKPGGLVTNPYRVTGGNILQQLSAVNRDGFGNEVAPHYNYLWISQLTNIADMLNKYDGYEGYDLYKNPKYVNMFKALTKVMLNNGTLQIGDSGAASKNELIYDVQTALLGYKFLNDDRFLTLIYNICGKDVANLHGSIYDKEPEEAKNLILSNKKYQTAFTNESENLTGYGLGYLTTNTPSASRDIWMNYTANIHHGHFDKLAMGMHAYGMDVMPDLGYPTAATENPERNQWVNNTISHNTVMVNKKKQSLTTNAGSPNHFSSQDGIKIMDVTDLEAYKGDVENYQRIMYMVDIDDKDSYYVDLFNVVGGNHHVYTLSALSQAVDQTSLQLKPNGSETYAKGDFAYGATNDAIHKLSGFTWLKNVEEQSNVKNFDVTFKLNDKNLGIKEEDGYRLKITSMNNEELKSAAVADGIPSQYPNVPGSIKYLLQEREGENLTSHFRSVIEPYHKQSNIKKISVPKSTNKDANTTILKVELVNGRIDYIVYSANPKQVKVDNLFTVNAKYAFVSYKDGKVVKEYVSDGTLNTLNSTNLTGSLVDFTSDLTTTSVVNLNEKVTDQEIADLVDTFIYFDTFKKENGAYRIRGAKRIKDNQIELSLGETNLINGFVDGNDISKGYEYNVDKGATFVIKRSQVYSLADTSRLEELVNDAQKLNDKLYTKDSLKNVKKQTKVAEALLKKDRLSQSEVNNMCEKLEQALKELVLKKADYSKVDEVLSKVEKLHSKDYTADSWKNLEQQIANVVRDLDITQQSSVDKMAKDIEDAMKSLKRVEITHIDKPSKPDKEEQPNKDDVGTSDTTSMITYTGLLSSAVATLAILLKKRKA